MYEPISCDFYDEIINTITLQQKVSITYKHEDHTLIAEGNITNVFTRDKEEFCVVNDLEIRLDKVVKIEVLE